MSLTLCHSKVANFLAPHCKLMITRQTEFRERIDMVLLFWLGGGVQMKTGWKRGRGGGLGGPVKVLVRYGRAVCEEGEKYVTAGRRGELREGVWGCGHERYVTVRLGSPLVMNLEMAGGKVERGKVVRVDLCEDCWERTRERLEGGGGWLVARWKVPVEVS